tara:strand:+ start:804 stop:1493 length:690 start_codon:yes stop_codon:yes gene_type:complete
MEILEQIGSSLGKMSGILTFTFLTLFTLTFFFKETIREWLNFKLKKRKPKEIKALLYHNMFLVADRVVARINNTDFTTFDGYDAAKTKMLNKLIELKITTVKRRFKEFLEQEDLDKIEAPELKFRVATTLSSLVNEYNDNAIRVMTDDMGVKMEDAKFLVDRYEEFRKYIVDAFVDELEVIVMDDNYLNNFDRLNTILYTVSMSLSIIPRDVVGVFNEINGRFKKYNNE